MQFNTTLLAIMTPLEVHESVKRGQIIVAAMRAENPDNEERLRFPDAVAYIHGRYGIERAAALARSLSPVPLDRRTISDGINRHIKLLRSRKEMFDE